MRPSATHSVNRKLVQAVEHHRGGRLQKAQELYLKVLKKAPDHTQALYLLGVLHLDRGRFSSGVELLHKVLALKPRHVDAHFSLGRGFQALGRYREAEEALRACLALEPRHADAWLSLGVVQAACGAYQTAKECYRKVLEIEPKAYKALTNLASIYMKCGQVEEGERYIAQAAALRPNDPTILCNLAATYIGQDNLALALRTYSGVLERDHTNIEALAGKANVLEKMSEHEAAFELVLPAIEQGSTNTNVALTFANLASHFNRTEEAVRLVQRYLDRRETGTDERCNLLFAKGKLLDSLGEYDRAFEAIRAANNLVPQSFDAAAHSRRVGNIIAFYSKENLARLPRASNESETPLFIVGMPRSGTSLIEQILASHQAVLGAGELTDIHDLVRSLTSGIENEEAYPECTAELDRRSLDAMADEHLARLRERGGDALRVTDKMPRNFLYLGLISQLLPKARIIHSVRDPLDTCLSCFFQNFRRGNFDTFNLDGIGVYYTQYYRLMQHWRETLDVPVMDLQYEDLVADLETWSRKLVDFVGLEWDPACLRFYDTKRVVNTASYDQVRQPIYTRSVGRWRNYERHLGPLKQALVPAMQHHAT
jgi:tetratricopeptide (TPR) repeat protein